MRLPPTGFRRLVSPVTVGVLLVTTGLCAVGAVVGLAAVPFGRRHRPLRIARFGLSYCLVELAVVGAAAGLWMGRRALRPRTAETERAWQRSNGRLLAWALGRVLGAARRCFGFRVELADLPAPDPLASRGPLLVLARHGGPGDSFALVHLLLTRYQRQVRVVLKDVLQLDPALDILLHRLGCCFLPSAGGDLADRLDDLAAGLGPGDALLLFPEGANWTPARRHRAIRHLRRTERRDAARKAALMTNVLPPRAGGVLACLRARPDLGVVVVAHAGLDRVTRVRQAWDQVPLHVPMTVRVWPAATVPTGTEGRLAWLTTEWAVVDEWIDAHRDGDTAGPAPSG